MSSSTDPLIHIADAVERAWRATDRSDGSTALVVPVVLADGSGANIVLSEIVGARLWGALDGRDPSLIDPPPTTRS
ncbi:hypothetical protein ACFXP3_10440 [Streptomyces sp. NPDC059096]|uniref:hypothetical protein n=1 Tax=Streptomyces sp. NPDC059096 TaxID=3346727 RepID=UPI0036B787A9